MHEALATATAKLQAALRAARRRIAQLEARISVPKFVHSTAPSAAMLEAIRERHAVVPSAKRRARVSGRQCLRLEARGDFCAARGLLVRRHRPARPASRTGPLRLLTYRRYRPRQTARHERHLRNGHSSLGSMDRSVARASGARARARREALRSPCPAPEPDRSRDGHGSGIGRTLGDRALRPYGGTRAPRWPGAWARSARAVELVAGSTPKRRSTHGIIDPTVYPVATITTSVMPASRNLATILAAPPEPRRASRSVVWYGLSV